MFLGVASAYPWDVEGLGRIRIDSGRGRIGNNSCSRDGGGRSGEREVKGSYLR